MEKAKVYFTKEITPKSLVRIYEKLEKELNGNVATLYSRLAIDGKGMCKLIEVEMNEDSFTLWAKDNQFLHFIKDGQKVDLYEKDELDWFY